MRSYGRLTEGDRHQVYALHKAGLRQSAIAEQIGVPNRRFAGSFIATKVCADTDQSRRTGWRVHDRPKFPAPVFWMEYGLGLKR